MLAIGRGLLTGPKLLLLDEPSQGLAPVIVNTVTSMLQDLKAPSPVGCHRRAKSQDGARTCGSHSTSWRAAAS